MNKGRILIVDDEPGMLHTVDRVLAPQYTTLALPSPAEAVAAATAFAPDLALLDIRMPGMSGFELMDWLRGTCPDLDVILMTGSVSDTDETHVSAILRKAFYFIEKPFDRRVLLTLVERCFELRRLTAENRQHLLRLQNELGAARAFQQSLLPAPAALIGGVSIAARYVPSVELGGDLYDYEPAGDGRIALVIADVAGHGASAAMLTGVVKSAFDSAHVEEYEPLSAVRSVAQGLRGFEPRRFVTLLAVRLDTRRGILDYVNAGHPPGLLWGGSGAPRWLAPTGPLISPALTGSTWDVGRVELNGAERLLLYTDGLTELERGGQGIDAAVLLAAIAAVPEGGNALLDHLLAQATAIAGSLPARDDITLLTATVGAAARDR